MLAYSGLIITALMLVVTLAQAHRQVAMYLEFLRQEKPTSPSRCERKLETKHSTLTYISTYITSTNRTSIRSPSMLEKKSILARMEGGNEKAAAREGDDDSNWHMSGREWQEKLLTKLEEATLAIKGVEHLLGEKMGKVDHKEIDTKALDDLVSVNSLFTIAVFVGLSIAAPDQLHGLEGRKECYAGPIIGKRLIVYEVVSFACFLLSSLAAKSLKVMLTMVNKKSFGKKRKAFMFSLSVVASVTGIVLLTLAMANVVQIKVGTLSCGSHHARTAVVSLSVIVGVAVAFVYLPAVVLAVVHCTGPTGSGFVNRYTTFLCGQSKSISR